MASQSLDTVTLPPVVDFFVLTIPSSIVRRRVRTESKGDRFNQRRTFAGPSLRESALCRLVNGQGIVAVDLDSFKTVSLTFDGDIAGRGLHRQRKRDGVLIVPAHEDNRKTMNAGNVHSGMK